MPDFIKTYEANKDKLTIVGVNMNDEPQEVKNFARDFKMNFPVTIDNTGDLVYKYRVPGHPTTFFINKEGLITGMVVGLTSPEKLQEELAKAFK